MDSDKKECILFFVKFPHRGLVKTRLAEKISPKFATELYKNFVLDTLKMLSGLPQDLRIFFDPPNDEENFKNWLGPSYNYVPQQGDDLGQKMKNAFQHVFAEGFSKAVIIGSDTPDLPKEHIDLAFKAMQSHDVVIGPADDGGYYLLGFDKNTFFPDVFENILWSSGRVFEQTSSVLAQRGKKVYLLLQWYDVDTSADLETLLLRNKNTAFRNSRTIQFILNSKIISDDGLTVRSGENV